MGCLDTRQACAVGFTQLLSQRREVVAQRLHKGRSALATAGAVDVALAELDLLFGGAASLYYLESSIQDWSLEPFIKGAYSFPSPGTYISETQSSSFCLRVGSFLVSFAERIVLSSSFRLLRALFFVSHFARLVLRF